MRQEKVVESHNPQVNLVPLVELTNTLASKKAGTSPMLTDLSHACQPGATAGLSQVRKQDLHAAPQQQQAAAAPPLPIQLAPLSLPPGITLTQQLVLSKLAPQLLLPGSELSKQKHRMHAWLTSLFQ
jgi:hypothetical protein